MQQEFITVTFNRTKIAIRCADILYVISQMVIVRFIYLMEMFTVAG